MSFHHHDVVVAKLVRKRLTALRFSGEEVKAALISLPCICGSMGTRVRATVAAGMDRFGGSSLCARRR